MYGAVVVQEILQRRQEPWRYEHSGWPLEVNNDQLSAVTKADPVKTTVEVDHSMVIWHLKQIGKVKKVDKWVPHELTANQKNHHFEMLSSLTVQRTISQSDSDVRRKVDFMTTGDNQLSDWTEKKLQSTSQNQICTKKRVIVTDWWSDANLINYSFLNPGKTITS